MTKSAFAILFGYQIDRLIINYIRFIVLLAFNLLQEEKVISNVIPHGWVGMNGADLNICSWHTCAWHVLFGW